jgi:hypothetical protein
VANWLARVQDQPRDATAPRRSTPAARESTPTASHFVAVGQLTEVSLVCPLASGVTMDSVDQVQAPPALVPVVVTPSPVAPAVGDEAASSPTATQVRADGQLTEKSSLSPDASGCTTVAPGHLQRTPFQLADATIPCWLTVRPTATHCVGVGQLTLKSRSTPVPPEGSAVGMLHRQDRSTHTALAVIA